MSDYRLASTDLGWVVYAGEEPLLVVTEESLALQIIGDAQALLQAHHARAALDQLGPPVPSPSLQVEASALTTPSQSDESPAPRSRPRNPDDASPQQS